jgi:hypothetical protein
MNIHTKENARPNRGGQHFEIQTAKDRKHPEPGTGRRTQTKSMIRQRAELFVWLPTIGHGSLGECMPILFPESQERIAEASPKRRPVKYLP